MTVRKMKISTQERRYGRASNRFAIGRGLRSNPCGGVGAARGNRGCLGIAAGRTGGSEFEERALRVAGSPGIAARARTIRGMGAKRCNLRSPASFSAVGKWNAGRCFRAGSDLVVEPVEHGGKANEAVKGDREFLVAGRDTAVTLDPAEEVFDHMAVPVKFAVEADRRAPSAAGRDAVECAGAGEMGCVRKFVCGSLK